MQTNLNLQVTTDVLTVDSQGNSFTVAHDPETSESFVSALDGTVTVTPQSNMAPSFILTPGQSVTVPSHEIESIEGGGLHLPAIRR